VIELADTLPDIEVQTAEYTRLLGYPRDWELRGRARELADWAREWYARHGRPWVYARQSTSLAIDGPTVCIDRVAFTSPRLLKTLSAAGADAAVLAAIGAGPEIEAEAQTLWQEGKPDEYFFLEVYGSAVVEHLVTMTGARLCAWADGQHLAVLPHYSPGYPEWDIAEQARLLEVIASGRHAGLPGVVEVMESGMLRPKKSLLAVFGVTPHVDRVRRLTDLIPCEHCSYRACQYRRVPYRRAPMTVDPELSGLTDDAEAASPPAAPLERQARYATNEKALARWAAERLVFTHRPDGVVEAVFRYDGTTCTNMGRPLAFDYHLQLGPRDEGYIIRAQRCVPAPGDDGYTRMCRYLSSRDQLMSAIAEETPLSGHPLNDVIGWTRPSRSAGCYCEPDSRQHKWGLVLETVHFALARDMDR
jgi:hypothetical protein